MSAIYHTPGHLIHRLQQISVSIFAAKIAEAGSDLTPIQFAALATIDAHPAIDQATLASLIAHDRSTMGDVVHRLCQKGLVARTVSTQDRRAWELTLTSAGNALLKRSLPIAQEVQEQILSGLSEQERVTFIKLLHKATDAGNELSRAPLRQGSA